MSRRIIVAVLLFSGLLLSVSLLGTPATGQLSSPDSHPTCSFPLSTTDATGEEITLSSKPTRIVALAPSDAQLLWDVNASVHVVGMPVSQYTAYLENHSRPTDVTGQDGLTVVTEQVVDLQPDLVLAGNITPKDTIEQLRAANITVYHLPTATRLDDIKQNIRTTGNITGECGGAESRIQWMNKEITAIQNATADETKPLVFFSMGDGWTAGAKTFQHEIIVTAGGENLAARANITGWQVISEEKVYSADPDWIVYSDTFDAPPLREGDRLTTAYESNQTIAVDAQYLNQPGPRVVLVINELARQFHPHAYNRSLEYSPAPPQGTTVPSSSPTQPGLTLITALLALCLFIMFATFRES